VPLLTSAVLVALHVECAGLEQRCVRIVVVPDLKFVGSPYGAMAAGSIGRIRRL
jgi:hypothetical protein